MVWLGFKLGLPRIVAQSRTSLKCVVTVCRRRADGPPIADVCFGMSVRAGKGMPAMS